MGLQGRARSHHATWVSCLLAHWDCRGTQLLGCTQTVWWGSRGHAELAQDLIHGQITINFTRKQDTIEHHMCPHTDDVSNINTVMRWCGARLVKTMHHMFCVSHLLLEGASYGIPDKKRELRPMHVAAECGHVVIMELLVDTVG